MKHCYRKLAFLGLGDNTCRRDSKSRVEQSNIYNQSMWLRHVIAISGIRKIKAHVQKKAEDAGHPGNFGALDYLALPHQLDLPHSKLGSFQRSWTTELEYQELSSSHRFLSQRETYTGLSKVTANALDSKGSSSSTGKWSCSLSKLGNWTCVSNISDLAEALPFEQVQREATVGSLNASWFENRLLHHMCISFGRFWIWSL